MKSTRDRSRVRRAWLRIGLLIVAVTPLASGPPVRKRRSRMCW
jgi:hypothetical protein